MIYCLNFLKIISKDELKELINVIIGGESESKSNEFSSEMRGIHDKLRKITKMNKKNKCIELIVKECEKKLKIKSNKNVEHILYDVGVGQLSLKNDVTVYKIILSPNINKIKRCFMLDNNSNDNYHITLGFNKKDIHSNNVNHCRSLLTLNDISRQNIDYLKLFLYITKYYHKTKDYQQMLKLLEFILDMISVKKNKLGYIKIVFYRALLYGMNKNYDACLNDCESILENSQFFVPAWITKGISLLTMKQPHEAIQVLWYSKQIFDMYLNNMDISKQKLKEYFDGEYLIKDPNNMEFNDTTINEEIKIYSNRLKKSINQCQSKLLQIPLSPRTRITVKFATNNQNIPQNTQWHEVKLPRNFSWVVYPYLCGVSIPNNKEQINAFKSMNIGLMVTIFDNKLSKDIIGPDTDDFKNILLKTLNYKAPKLYDLKEYIKEAEHWIFKRNKAVIVHCGGGKGMILN